MDTGMIFFLCVFFAKGYILKTSNTFPMRTFFSFLILVIALFTDLHGAKPQKVIVGAEQLFTDHYIHLIKGKRLGLITNHTAVNSRMISTIDLLKKNASKYGFTLSALFAPEHGITGAAYAEENVKKTKTIMVSPIYSLHGDRRRPPKKC